MFSSGSTHTTEETQIFLQPLGLVDHRGLAQERVSREGEATAPIWEIFPMAHAASLLDNRFLPGREGRRSPGSNLEGLSPAGPLY